MPGRNPYEKSYRTNISSSKRGIERHCLVIFPSENSHGIWPERLIRRKGRFNFEAKYGQQWFECRIETEGTMEECHAAQCILEKEKVSKDKQWSSAETELSGNDDSGSDEENTTTQGPVSKSTVSKKVGKKKKKNKEAIIQCVDEDIILEDINKSIIDCGKRTNAIDLEANSTKKKKSDEQALNVEEVDVEPSHTTSLEESNRQSLKTLDETRAGSMETKLEELKKMITKVYVLQKRSTDINQKSGPPVTTESMVVNNINLMSLPGKTPSRFLLSAARVILTNDEFINGYLPDFRGSKEGRVPIPEESVRRLKDAVRLRFSFKEEDMHSVWSSIRTSLVQKVTDVRKANKRKIQLEQSTQIRQNVSMEKQRDVNVVNTRDEQS